MAQSLACMVGVSGGLKLEGLAAQGATSTLKFNGNSAVVVRSGKTNVISASLAHEEETRSSRRSMISLLAASAGVVLAQKANALTDIVLEGPPPPSGGLPGTENADQARDFDLDLAKRFFIQPLGPSEAVARVKAAVDEITSVKSLIDKKAWPYVQNDLRSKAQYLGYDLKTIIDSKAKTEKKQLLALKSKLFDTINNLDYAARAKSSSAAEKYYAETVSLLNKFVALLA